MKNIKYYLEYINEALKDEIPQHYVDIIKKRHGKVILSKDVPKHTDKIPNVKIEITNQELLKPILEKISEGVEKNIRDEFRQSDFYRNIVGNVKVYNNGIQIVDFLNIKNIKLLLSNEINLPNMKIELPNNEYEISKNKSSIVKFLTYLNKLKGTNYSIENDKKFKGIMSFLGDYNNNLNNIKNDKIYLYISDKSYDKLNMSLSKYYSSCQNIYSGELNDHLLANVFDVNTKVAYVISETPFYDEKGNKIEYSPLYRCLIRYDEYSDKIFFDETYPNGNNDLMRKIIEEYTDLKHENINTYIYKVKENLPKSYQDNLLNISDIDLTTLEIKKIIKKEYPEAKIKVINKDEIFIDNNEFRLLSEKDVYDELYQQKIEYFGEQILGDKEDFFNILMEHVILCKDIITFLNIKNEELEEIANNVDKNYDLDYRDDLERFFEILESLDIDYENELNDVKFTRKYFNFKKYLDFYKEYRDYDMLSEFDAGEMTKIEYNNSMYYLEPIY